MALNEKEELELLELENENALAQKGANTEPLVPGMTPEDQDLAQSSTAGLAAQAAGEALNTEIPGLSAAKTGLESAAADAGKFYTELGVPKVGKAVEMGGRFVAGMIPARMKDALFVAAAGPALELAAIAGRPAVKAGGNLLADVAASIAGKSPEAVKAIYKSPGALWKKATEVFTLKHQEAVVKAIDDGLAARGAQFKQLEEAMSGFAVNPGQVPARLTSAPRVELKGVFDDVTKEMLWRGHKLPKSLTGKTPVKVGRIAENASEYRELVSKLELLKKSKQMDFGEALNLRRQLDEIINYGVEGSNGLQPLSGEGQRVLKLMRRRLNSQIRESVPGPIRPVWDKANFEYSKASQAYAELKRQVIGTTPRQTERKLMQMIQEGRYEDEVVARVEKLGEQAAKALDDVRDHLAAREFQRWTASGIRAGTPLGVPTSPRLIGGAVSATGAAAKATQAAVTPMANNPIRTALGIQGLSNVPQP